jgi:valyl-tRNA synthetase
MRRSSARRHAADSPAARVTVIADSYVDKEFGTGAVKITPAHDFNDWQVAQRHGLESLTILNSTRRSTTTRPRNTGGSIATLRARPCSADLRAQGLLVSEKPHRMVVPRCGRTGEIVEPMLTDQWFVAMKTPAPATHPLWPGRTIQDLCLAAVDEGLKSPRTGATNKVEFVPDSWLATYLHWINNIQDWCISRQLWWGHRSRRGTTKPATSMSRATKPPRARKRSEARPRAAKLRQDPDVLDTWFLVGAVVSLDARLARGHARAATFLPRRCWSRASTSSSSGSRGW